MHCYSAQECPLSSSVCWPALPSLPRACGYSLFLRMSHATLAIPLLQSLLQALLVAASTTRHCNHEGQAMNNNPHPASASP